jgi:two-component system, OmpR family, response regulator
MKVLTFLPRLGLQRRIEVALSSAHFVVEKVDSAEGCADYARFEQYKAILIDSDSLIFRDLIVMLGVMRQENRNAALLVFAHYLEPEQRLHLFEAGADDCVQEPFFAAELALRLGLLVRLRQASALGASLKVNVLRSNDFELDLLRRRAVRSGKAIHLRPKEFLLLEYLARNVDRPVTRAMILEHVWNSSGEGLANVVEVHISSLRRKVDRGFCQKLIQTNHGVGYTFTGVRGSHHPID